MSGVRVHDVDGVRLLLVERSGPWSGGLVVRAGTADEAPLGAGRMHVVQHLVLSGLSGTTDRTPRGPAATTTAYAVTGTAEHVVRTLTTVATRLTDPLRDLPTDALATAVHEVRVEHSARPKDVAGHLLRAAYGVAGHGSSTGPQLGLDDVDAETVVALCRRSATRSGAVAWLAGPWGGTVPAGLRLPLPDGPATAPPPDPRHLLAGQGFPRWVRTPALAVGVLGVVGRDDASRAFVEVLADRLRHEVLATATAVATPLTADATALLVTPGAGADVGALMPLLLTCIERTAADEHSGGVSREGLATWAEAHLARPTEPEALALARDLVLGVAEGVVLAREGRSTRGQDVPATAPRDVAEAARAFLGTAVAGLDHSVAAVRGPWRLWSGETSPAGRRHLHADAPSDTRVLVAGPGVVAREQWPLDPVVVRADATAAVRRWPDGRRLLLGDDGTELDIEPTLWVGGAQVVNLVDEGWPDAVVRHEPERAGSQVPRPSLDTRGKVDLAPITSTIAFRHAVIGTSAYLLVLSVLLVVVGFGPSFAVPMFLGFFAVMFLWQRVIIDSGEARRHDG